MLVKLTIIWLMGISAMTLGVMAGIMTPRPRLPILPILLATAYALTLLVSTALSHQRSVAVIGLHRRYGGLVPQLLYMSVFLTIVMLYRTTPQRLKYLGAALTVASMLVATYTLIQAAGLDWNTWTIDGQPPEFPISTLGNSNFAGGYLAITIPFAIYFAITARSSWTRLTIAVGSAVQVLALWYTHTRGGLLAIVISVSATAILARDLLPRWARTAAVLTGAAVLSGSVFALWPGQSQVPGPEVLVRTNTLKSRYAYWHSATSIIGDSPLIGTGPDTFYANYGRHEAPGQASNEPTIRVDKPHNVVLERGVNSGLPGLALYLALVVTILAAAYRRSRRLSGRERALCLAFMASLLAYEVESFFSIDVPPLAVLGWVCLGGLVAIAYSFDTKPDPASTERKTSPVGAARILLMPAIATLALALLYVGVRPLRAEIAARDGRIDDAMTLNPLEAEYRDQAGDRAFAGASASWDPVEQLRQFRLAQSYYVRAVQLQPGNFEYVIKVAMLNIHWAENLDSTRFSVADAWWKRALVENPNNAGLKSWHLAVMESTRRFRNPSSNG
jgi:O-antigen ligase